MFSEWATFLVHLIFFIDFVFSNVNWCDPVTYNNTNHADKAKRIDFSKQYFHRACYFVLKEMNEKATKPTTTGEPISLEEARALCKEFGATLTTVHAKEESMFIGKLGGLVLLGANVTLPKIDLIDKDKVNISRMPIIQGWDDGVVVDYVPDIWWFPKFGDPPTKLYTYISYSMKLTEPPTWESVGPDGLKNRIDKLIIPCKQNLTHPLSGSTNIVCHFGGIVVGYAVMLVVVFGRVLEA